MISQNLPEIQELYLKLPNSDQKKLMKAEELISEAEEILGKAREIYSQKSGSYTANGMRELEVASFKFKTAAINSYEVYNEHISEFMENIDAIYRENLDRGKHYQKRASNYFQKSKNNRDSLKYVKDFTGFFNLLLETAEYERMAIINMARTLRIYQDWPIEYDYVWDDFIRPIDPLLAEEMRRDSVLATKAEQQPSLDSNIVFKVQIAAHRIEMSEDYLRRSIYKGDREIKMIYNDGWYKYDIGTFYNYDEAKRAVRKCRVEKAFIAAYLNDKRISINDAMTRTTGIDLHLK
ncbi:MAG: hypothetical protein ACOCUV_03030 [bacterium]